MWFCKLMWRNLKEINKDKSKGFTLIELLLSLTTGLVIIMTAIIILNLFIKSNKIVETNNDIMANGRYALEYIKQEVRLADKIISSHKFSRLNERFQSNFGFVIVKYNPSNYLKYSYCTYYFEDNKIIRVATNTSNFTFPSGQAFSGHNIVAEYIKSVDEIMVDFNNRLIRISLTLEDKDEQKLEMTIGMRCPVIY